MALNLLTLTKTNGEKIEVNPQAIAFVETTKDVTIIKLISGGEVQVNEPQSKVRELANKRAPDGF